MIRELRKLVLSSVKPPLMILRRKEIAAAALVVLIGMAGYLNWNYQDNLQIKDGDDFIETGKKIGEAQLVMNQNVDEEEKEATFEPTKTEEAPDTSSSDYFENAKLERENARAKSLEILNQTAENKEFDNEIRKKAQTEILAIAKNTENEATIENLAKAKGYDKICVFINEDIVNISVQKAEFSDKDIAKIQAIATEQLKISADKLKIVEVK